MIINGFDGFTTSTAYEGARSCPYCAQFSEAGHTASCPWSVLRLGPPLTKEAVARWVSGLLSSHGVRTEQWNNGEVGMHNVPAKWAGVINDMSSAMQILATDGTLPKLLPRGKGKVVR